MSERAPSSKPLPSVKKRARFLAHRRSPRQILQCCTLQGDIRRCDEPGKLKAGYTVSKRNGPAVERNRIKRRLKHALARAAGDMADGGAEGSRQLCGEIIVIARRDALTLPHHTLVAELTKGIDRLLSKSKKAGKQN